MNDLTAKYQRNVMKSIRNTVKNVAYFELSNLLHRDELNQ